MTATFTASPELPDLDRVQFEAAWRAKYDMPASVPFSTFADGLYQAPALNDTYEGWCMARRAQQEGEAPAAQQELREQLAKDILADLSPGRTDKLPLERVTSNAAIMRAAEIVRGVVAPTVRAATPSAPGTPEAPGLGNYELARLRRLMVTLGHADAFQQPDEYVCGVMCTVFGQAAGELERLRALLNTPELHDFSKGVVLEAAHQRERWSTSHDAGKAPADWFWLLGYLGGKALRAHIDGNTEKVLHHTISMAAACANWHAAILGKTSMRPGIEPPAEVAVQLDGRQGEEQRS